MTTSIAEKPQTPNGRISRIWLLAGGGLLLGLLLGWLLIARPFSPTFNGIVMQSPSPVTNFTLTGPEGQPVSLRDFRGKIVILYYGYTFCPDVCPATLTKAAHARQLLGKQADEVQVIMVSLDPQRDTPQTLATYMNYFDPTFIGLTGSGDDIAAATIPLGIYYQVQEHADSDSYLIDHTATTSVIDRHGYLRLVYPFGTTSEEMAADLRRLVRER